MKKFMFILLIGVFTLAACSDDTEEIEAPEQESLEEGQAPEVIEDSEVPDELTETAESFLSSFANGDFEQATENFSDMMSDELSADELQDLSDQLQEQLGDFSDYEYNQAYQVNEFYMLSYDGAYAEAEVTFDVSLDEDNQIVGFFVQPS